MIVNFVKLVQYLWTPKPWKMKVLGPQDMGHNLQKWRFWLPLVLCTPGCSSPHPMRKMVRISSIKMTIISATRCPAGQLFTHTHKRIDPSLKRKNRKNVISPTVPGPATCYVRHFLGWFFYAIRRSFFFLPPKSRQGDGSGWPNLAKNGEVLFGGWKNNLQATWLRGFVVAGPRKKEGSEDSEDLKL